MLLLLPLHFAIVANNRPFISPPEELILQKREAFRSFATNNISAYIFQYRSQQATTNFYHLKFTLCYAGRLLFLLLQLLQRCWDSEVWLQARHPSPKFYFSYLSYYLCCHWFLENQWGVPNKKMKPLKNS